MKINVDKNIFTIKLENFNDKFWNLLTKGRKNSWRKPKMPVLISYNFISYNFQREEHLICIIDEEESKNSTR